MKNLDFYRELLNHSLCYKYNEQIKIAKEYCDMIKENTIKKSIMITRSCPKYILDILENYGGLEIIYDHNNPDSLYNEFNEITKNIPTDKKYNYEIIIKNFCCGNYSDISKYIKEINEKLIDSHNMNINTIISLLIDVPNYYIEAINLYNKYNYEFDTPKATLTYHDLFGAVYRRLKNPNSFNFAIKELISLIVLYHDVMNLPFDKHGSAFLNPIVEPIKSSMIEQIEKQCQLNLVNTIDSFTSLDVDVTESEAEFIFNETDHYYVSECMYVNGIYYTVEGNIDIAKFGFDTASLLKDVYQITNTQRDKKLRFNIPQGLIIGLKHDHSLNTLQIGYAFNKEMAGNTFKSLIIVEYNDLLYLLYCDDESDYDICGIEVENDSFKSVKRDIIGIDMDSDNTYIFIL